MQQIRYGYARKTWRQRSASKKIVKNALYTSGGEDTQIRGPELGRVLSFGREITLSGFWAAGGAAGRGKGVGMGACRRAKKWYAIPFAAPRPGARYRCLTRLGVALPPPRPRRDRWISCATQIHRSPSSRSTAPAPAAPSSSTRLPPPP